MGRLFWGLVASVWILNAMLSLLWDTSGKEYAGTMALVALGVWSVLKRIDDRAEQK